MHTPAHVFLNVFVLKKFAPAGWAAAAVALGAVIPDLPSTVFYAIERFIHATPETKIWQSVYPNSYWPHLTTALHSFVIVGGLFLLSRWFKFRIATLLFTSMFLHAVFDFPTHNIDAHAHFFPLSDYRFVSPVSYWDFNHYGQLFGLAELAMVVAVSIYLWKFSELKWWVVPGLAGYLAIYAYSLIVWA